jgi:hypothetical protein
MRIILANAFSFPVLVQFDICVEGIADDVSMIYVKSICDLHWIWLYIFLNDGSPMDSIIVNNRIEVLDRFNKCTLAVQKKEKLCTPSVPKYLAQLFLDKEVPEQVILGRTEYITLHPNPSSMSIMKMLVASKPLRPYCFNNTLMCYY